MNPACPTFDCPCGNNPLSGYLSEAVDTFPRLATAYVELEPPFGTECCDRGCVAFASEVLPPPGAGLGPITQQFFSAPQQCTVFCPDGTPFVFEVSPGAFTAATQAAADAAAMAYACQQANARLICLGPLTPATFTTNAPYNGSISASGDGLDATNTWEIISGSLPDGLVFNGGSIAGNTVTITGTPTVGGSFTFTVQVSSQEGNTATKTSHAGLRHGLRGQHEFHRKLRLPRQRGAELAVRFSHRDVRHAMAFCDGDRANQLRVHFSARARASSR